MIEVIVVVRTAMLEVAVVVRTAMIEVALVVRTAILDQVQDDPFFGEHCRHCSFGPPHQIAKRCISQHSTKK